MEERILTDIAAEQFLLRGKMSQNGAVIGCENGMNIQPGQVEEGFLG